MRRFLLLAPALLALTSPAFAQQLEVRDPIPPGGCAIGTRGSKQLLVCREHDGRLKILGPVVSSQPQETKPAAKSVQTKPSSNQKTAQQKAAQPKKAASPKPQTAQSTSSAASTGTQTATSTSTPSPTPAASAATAAAAAATAATPAVAAPAAPHPAEATAVASPSSSPAAESGAQTAASLNTSTEAPSNTAPTTTVAAPDLNADAAVSAAAVPAAEPTATVSNSSVPATAPRAQTTTSTTAQSASTVDTSVGAVNTTPIESAAPPASATNATPDVGTAGTTPTASTTDTSAASAAAAPAATEAVATPATAANEPSKNAIPGDCQTIVAWAREAYEYRKFISTQLLTTPPFKNERIQQVFGKPLYELSDDEALAIAKPSGCSEDAVQKNMNSLVFASNNVYRLRPWAKLEAQLSQLRDEAQQALRDDDFKALQQAENKFSKYSYSSLSKELNDLYAEVQKRIRKISKQEAAVFKEKITAAHERLTKAAESADEEAYKQVEAELNALKEQIDQANLDSSDRNDLKTEIDHNLWGARSTLYYAQQTRQHYQRMKHAYEAAQKDTSDKLHGLWVLFGRKCGEEVGGEVAFAPKGGAALFLRSDDQILRGKYKLELPMRWERSGDVVSLSLDPKKFNDTVHEAAARYIGRTLHIRTPIAYPFTAQIKIKELTKDTLVIEQPGGSVTLKRCSLP